MSLIKIPITDSTYISERYRFNNYFNSNSIRIKLDRKFSCISLLKFDNKNIPYDRDIKRATLNLFVNEINDTTANYSFNKVAIYRNLEDFNQESVFWNNSPRKSREPVGFINISNKNVGTFVECDITDLMRSWRNGSVPNFGVSIMVSKSSFYDDVYISSKGGKNPPTITIEYFEDCAKNNSHFNKESYKISKDYFYKNYNYNNCKLHRNQIINNFSEKIFILRNRDSNFFSEIIKTINSRTISFFIQNLGVTPVDVNLQISPDGITFLDDPQKITLTSQNMIILAPYMFAKYIRVAIKSQGDYSRNKIKVWYQAQLLNYTLD